jgi:hypothetical protein
MPIPVICSCGGKMRVADNLAGKHVKCPKCGTLLAVTTAGGAPVAAAPAPAPPPPPPADTKTVLAGSSLSETERDRVEDVLESEERLVWADKPLPEAAFRRGWLISLGFFASALVMLIITVVLLVVEKGGDLWFAAIPGLGGLALVGVGVANPYMARYRAERTSYAFTNKRAMVWECNLMGKIDLLIYPPAIVSGMYRPAFARRDGPGDIMFGNQVQRDRRGAVRRIKRHGFFFLRNPDQVEKLMREQLITPFTDKLYE